MSIETELQARSNSACELCGATNELSVYAVKPAKSESADNSVYVCSTCNDQLENPEKTIANHWRCLNDSMWSTVPAVQVTAWRMLNSLKAEGWPQDLLDMLYLDEATLAWAQEGESTAVADDSVKHIDSNGSVLQSGDTVVLIKDLEIKGSTFAGKRGTSVRNIILVRNNPEQIEGRVNGQEIVILTKFVKKAG